MACAETVAIFEVSELVKAAYKSKILASQNQVYQTFLCVHVTWLDSDEVVDTTDVTDEFNAIIDTKL